MQTKHPSLAQASSRDSSSSITDSYFTITERFQSEIKIHASRFISFLAPTTSADAFNQWLDTIRSTYYDATHHCFAYRIGIDGAEFRSSDDGEPSGTAGKKILSSLVNHRLTNAGLIVVRYFGGTKLGTGGLARAYNHAAAGVIAHAIIHEKWIMDRLELSFESQHLHSIHHCIDAREVKIIKQDYDQRHRYTIEIRTSFTESFIKELRDATNNGIEISDLK